MTGRRARTSAPRVALAALLLAGCATAPVKLPTSPLLARGDARLGSGDYRAAIAFYDEFLRREPDDPAAARVRATRLALARLLESEAALEQLRDEGAQRAGEQARARRELEAARAETTRLRADLERIKALDLQLEQRTR